MPTTKSATKAMRQSIKRRAKNLIKKEAYKAAIKKVKKLALGAKKSEADEAFITAMQALDKAAKTHVLHKNTASRLKSRLAKMIAKIK